MKSDDSIVTLPEDILDKSPKDILAYIEVNVGLIDLTVGIDIFKDVDLSIIEFVPETSGGLFKKDVNMREELLIKIEGIGALQTTDGRKNYVSKMLEFTDNVRALPSANFNFNKDRNLVFTDDFRVIVKDNTARIPEHIIQSVISAAYLSLGGLIDQNVAYAYITDIMKEYGVPFMEFKSQGYMTIDLYRNQDDRQYKSQLFMADKGLKP